jgi:hypothetical protein
MEDLIGYDEIIESSMRQVIYKVLKKVEKEGLKGNHHFVISFSINYPGVSIPNYLQEKFHEEMTIVVQHQFSALLVGENDFKINLTFSGNSERLVIPYLAVTSFADPSINFGLKFNKMIVEETAPDAPHEDIDLSAKIISLDDFRKNRDK